MTGDVWECEVLGTDEFHGRSFEQRVMLFTDKSGILDRL